MPGIVGCITRQPREQVEPKLARMMQCMVHEDFYDSGLYIDEALGMYVGWVARKGSFSDGMPIRNERGDVILAFSGEEYPEPGTAQRLRLKSHEFDPVGPSYLVHLYEDDESFPAGLNGRFHGLVIDQRLKAALLFNDRFGMHRLYYHESNDAFYFAAEAKAILAVCPETRQLCLRGLGEFLSCGCVLENRTLFKGIDVLPPGSAWKFGLGSLQSKKSYFVPAEWENQEKLDSESYYRGLRDVLRRNLPRYFDGVEPVAMSLTGGLDTRMLMAWQKAEPEELPCYTFGGMLRECQDVTVARQVAGICKQRHDVIRVDEEFLSRFAHYAERTVYLTDGCAGVDRAPDLFLNERARAIAPVRMTGNYGGEILRGVRAFKPEPLSPGIFQPDVLRHVEQAAETCAGIVKAHPVSFAVFRQGPWHHYGILALEQTQLSMRSPYLDNDLVKTALRAPESSFTNSDTCLRLVADGNPALGRLPTDRGVGGSGTSRLCQEFLFKAEYAYDMGMPQWLARFDHALSGLHLERLFLGRHKIFHFRTWYRERLADYVRQVLLDSPPRSYVKEAAMQTALQSHLGGRRNCTLTIHKLLTLEILHRRLLEIPEPRVSRTCDGPSSVALSTTNKL